MTKISILATKEFCPHCARSVWMHGRFGRFVCRGDIRPSDNYEVAVANGVNPGCQREFEKVANGPH